MARYNALVIGLGRIGLGFDLTGPRDQILTHTKAYLMNKNFNLIGGIDIDARARRDFTSFCRRRSYASVKEFRRLNDSKIDVVSLCTPSHIRLTEFSKAISLKPRLVMIEKPIAMTLKEARAIKRIARDRQIKVYVNYMRRVDPFFSRLKAMLDNKRFGEPVFISITYTGGLYKNASHFIDLMLGYFGPPKSVRRIKTISSGRGDTDCSFVLRYPSFDINFSCVPSDTYSVGDIDIFLSKGKVSISGFGARVSAFDTVGDPVFSGFNMLRRRSLSLKPALDNYQAYVVAHIANVLKHDQEPISDAGSAIATLSVCRKVQRGN
jgi:predicted dehydrogenase